MKTNVILWSICALLGMLNFVLGVGSNINWMWLITSVLAALSAWRWYLRMKDDNEKETKDVS